MFVNLNAAQLELIAKHIRFLLDTHSGPTIDRKNLERIIDTCQRTAALMNGGRKPYVVTFYAPDNTGHGSPYTDLHVLYVMLTDTEQKTLRDELWDLDIHDSKIECATVNGAWANPDATDETREVHQGAEALMASLEKRGLLTSQEEDDEEELEDDDDLDDDEDDDFDEDEEGDDDE